jgi:hypothetical protein
MVLCRIPTEVLGRLIHQRLTGVAGMPQSNPAVTFLKPTEPNPVQRESVDIHLYQIVPTVVLLTSDLNISIEIIQIHIQVHMEVKAV